MRFARRFASWRGSTILTSIPGTNPPRRSSRRSPRRTTFSATRKNARSTIRLGFIPTISIPRRPRPMREAEARVDLREARREDPRAAQARRADRVFHSILADSIFLIWPIARVEAGEAAVGADLKTSSRESSAVVAEPHQQVQAPKRVAISNTK